MSAVDITVSESLHEKLMNNSDDLEASHVVHLGSPEMKA